jgi:hypothetical protein
MVWRARVQDPLLAWTIHERSIEAANNTASALPSLRSSRICLILSVLATSFTNHPG